MHNAQCGAHVAKNGMKTDNVIVDKSKEFAIAVVRLYQQISSDRKEFVLSRQFGKCGTSIGANVHEAVRAQSHADFISKMSIALKEAEETEYWLDLLHETDYVDDSSFHVIQSQNGELLRLLMAICKTANTKKA